ncbi:hypothetical protein V8D89_009033 [Ganoderma adspersum]
MISKFESLLARHPKTLTCPSHVRGARLYGSREMYDPGRLRPGARSRAFSASRNRRENGVAHICADALQNVSDPTPILGGYASRNEPEHFCGTVHRAGVRARSSNFPSVVTYALSITSRRVKGVGDLGAVISGSGYTVRVPSAGYMLASRRIRRVDFADTGNGSAGNKTSTLMSTRRSSATPSRFAANTMSLYRSVLVTPSGRSFVSKFVQITRAEEGPLASLKAQSIEVVERNALNRGRCSNLLPEHNTGTLSAETVDCFYWPVGE